MEKVPRFWAMTDQVLQQGLAVPGGREDGRWARNWARYRARARLAVRSRVHANAGGCSPLGGGEAGRDGGDGSGEAHFPQQLLGRAVRGRKVVAKSQHDATGRRNLQPIARGIGPRRTAGHFEQRTGQACRVC